MQKSRQKFFTVENFLYIYTIINNKDMTITDNQKKRINALFNKAERVLVNPASAKYFKDSTLIDDIFHDNIYSKDNAVVWLSLQPHVSKAGRKTTNVEIYGESAFGFVKNKSETALLDFLDIVEDNVNGQPQTVIKTVEGLLAFKTELLEMINKL